MAINREFIEANHADIAQAIRAEGHAAGVKESQAAIAAAHEAGAAAERQRIEGIEAAALPGCEDLIQQFKADGKTTPEQASVKIVQHYKGINAGALATLEKDAAALPLVPASASASGTVVDTKSAQQKAEEQWNADANLRGEFGNDKAAYDAYNNAFNDGKIRVLGKRAG